MKLTGKAKENFEGWFGDEIYATKLFATESHYLGIDDFYNFHESMQWGVYVDFFDSKAFEIAARREDDKYIWYVGLSERDFYINTKQSLSEARKAAIEKANEIYNLKHKEP